MCRRGLYQKAREVRICPTPRPSGNDDDEGEDGEAATDDGSDKDDHCMTRTLVIYSTDSVHKLSR